MKMGPIANAAEGAVEELKELSSKHWICKGIKSIAIATELLKQGKVVALATDTVYGIACSASDTDAIKRLYEIKGRNENKPLCICISNVKNVNYWGVTDHLNPRILPTLLPGPYTIVLKRQPTLNPDLNPGIDTIGIRVPNNRFINCVTHVVGPLALTSANVSNEPSCLYPKEFSALWPQLDGIFYDVHAIGLGKEEYRKGSTIVDLSVPNYYKIIRKGVGAKFMKNTMKTYCIEPVTNT